MIWVGWPSSLIVNGGPFKQITGKLAWLLIVNRDNDNARKKWINDSGRRDACLVAI